MLSYHFRGRTRPDTKRRRLWSYEHGAWLLEGTGESRLKKKGNLTREGRFNIFEFDIPQDGDHDPVSAESTFLEADPDLCKAATPVL